MGDADDLYGRQHVDRYRDTGGAVGHDWRGATTLILTTKGRRSGERRSTPLIYRERDGDHVIVASKGGSPEPPAWWLNLEADQDAEIEVMDERFRVRAREAEGEEREELWKLMNEQSIVGLGRGYVRSDGLLQSRTIGNGTTDPGPQHDWAASAQETRPDAR